MPYIQYNNTKEPFVELLCGVSNSGKSTYVLHQYPNGFDGLILSRDDLVLKHGVGITYNECWSSLTDELHKTIDKKLEIQYISALKQKQNIIVDMTNLTRKRRNLWLNSLPNNYTKKIRLFVTTLDRVKERNIFQAKNKFIPEEVLEDMYKRFQEPNTGEFDELIIEHT